MKRLAIILTLLAAPSAWAQKVPAYECWVLEADGSDYITLGLVRDGNFAYKT